MIEINIISIDETDVTNSNDIANDSSSSSSSNSESTDIGNNDDLEILNNEPEYDGCKR